MATGDNAILPLFEDGDRTTAAITAAVSAGTFVRVSGTYQAGPLLNVASPIVGGNLKQIATCAAGARAYGVAVCDGVTAGDVIGVITLGATFEIPMIAGANITAGQEVESDAAGKPIPLAAGRPNGYACSTATTGNVVWIKTS